MGLLTELLGKARTVFSGRAAAPPKPSETHAIESTSFDRDAWAKVLSTQPNLRNVAQQLAMTVDNAKELQEDLHASLYKVQPRMRSVEQMAESHTDNHRVMSQVVQMPEFQNLRLHSAGDAYIAAVAMGALQEPMLNAVRQVEEAHADAERQRAEAEARAEEAAQQMQELADAAQQAEANGSPIEQQIAEENLAATVAEYEAAAQAAAQAADASQNQAASAVRGVVKQLREATAEVLDQLDKDKALFAAYGVDEGELQRMSPDERIALAERLRNDRLADFAKLIGQFKSLQRAKSRKRVVNAHDQVYGLELSGNFERMVGSEYMALAHPALRAQLMIRIAEKRVLTHKMRGRSKVGQGPIICVVDESESMTGTDVQGGTREAWSKALALALLDQARRRERDFIYIGFASKGQQHVIEFKRGETTLDKVLTMTSHFFKGGTYFETPLETALNYAETHYSSTGQKRPDIVFITDGEYRALPDDFMSRYRATKHRTGVETYGIAIGCRSTGALEQISDNCREIGELTSPNDMGDIFTTI